MDILRIINKASDDGAEISSNMLKFAKAENDTNRFVPANIKGIISQSIDFAKPRWKNEAQALRSLHVVMVILYLHLFQIPESVYLKV